MGEKGWWVEWIINFQGVLNKDLSVKETHPWTNLIENKIIMNLMNIYEMS